MKRVRLYFLILLSVVFILSCSVNKKKKQQEEICQKAVKGAELFVEGDKEGEVLLKEVWEYFLEYQEDAMNDSEYGKGNASKTEVTMLYGIFSGYTLGYLSVENMDDFSYLKNLKIKNPEFYDFFDEILKSCSPMEIAEKTARTVNVKD